MPQTANGRGTPQGASSVFQQGHRVFVAGADVQPQRLAAYGDEYADIALKGTHKAICLPAGGELHQPDGTILPVAPWDWVVELPDGTLGSYNAEHVADHFELVDGPDLQKEAFAETVKRVKHARERPRRNPPIKVDHQAEVLPHPDHGEAADREFDARAKANLQADLQRQAREARAQLEAVIGVAKKRKLIDDGEANEWLDTGFAPEGVQVTFQQALGSWEVTRAPAPSSPSEPGTEPPVVEGEPEKPSGK